jgi:hypothetical protein
MKRFVVSMSTILVGVLLAACSSVQVRNEPTARPCRGEACDPIAVNVTSECPPPDGVEDVSFKGGRGFRTLRWVINGPWQFSQDPYQYAIYLKKGGNLLGGRMGAPTFSPDRKTMEIKWDRKADGAYFQYGLNLKNADGKYCTIDPWIYDDV